MALINCPECENQISDKAKSCPICGYPIKKRIIEWEIAKVDEEIKPKAHKSENSQLLKVLGGFFGVIIFLAIIVNTCDDKKSSHSEVSTNQLNSNTAEIKIKYSKESLNIREKPNTESKIVNTLKPNEEVRTKGIQENGFIQILNSKDQICGWCSSGYLQDKPLTKEEIEKTISNDIGYSIIAREDDTTGNYKGMSFKIQLNEKNPNDSIIKKICNTIWRNGNTHWDGFHIFVYKPNMRIEDTAYCLVLYSNKGFEKITYFYDTKVAPKDEKWKRVYDKFEVMVMAKNFVTKNLKSPRTAEFPWSVEEYKITSLGDQEFTVSSYVDSQNSFGALLRENYTVKIKQVSKTEWQFLEILFYQ